MCRNLVCVLLMVLVWGAGGVASGGEDAAAVPKDKNLVGWWKLDETSGTTVADSSGHGRKGRLADDLSFDRHSVEGRIGKAIEFEGKRGRIQIDEYHGVTGTAPRTVAAWIKTSQRKGDIIRWGADDAGRIFRFGFIRGRVGLDPSGGYLYVNADLADDAWHHVAIVVVAGDPPNLHDSVELYVDGAPAAIHDIGLLDLWPLDTGDAMEVAIGQGFQGAIDEIRLYDRALSAEEIHALFKVR